MLSSSKLLISLSILLFSVSASAAKTPIREFLGGSENYKGMGFENPSVVELVSLSYGALNSIRNRILETEEKLKGNLSDAERARYELRLKRSKIQYRLAWETLRIFVARSMEQYDLRGVGSKFGKGIFNVPHEENEKQRRDQQIKLYILEKSHELFLGSIKFLSLKQDPVFIPKNVSDDSTGLEWGDNDESTFKWLDDPRFALNNPDAGKNFMLDNSIQPYRNVNIIPAAEDIVEGFEHLVRTQEFVNIDLAKPTREQKEALYHKVLGKNADKWATKKQEGQMIGLVTFYAHVLGSLIDPFNVNTHDSYEIMRATLTALFRHVIDLEGNEKISLVEATKYAALPKDLPNYRPLTAIVGDVSAILKKQYFAAIAAGPKLRIDKRDREEKNREYLVYHGSVLKDIFGNDLSHWIFPKGQAWEDDPRLVTALPESRKADGSARDEMKSLQDGDLWMEKGTGMGSDLISWATAPSTPKQKTQSYIEKSSLWGIAKSKLYYVWSGTLGWVEDKLQIGEFPEWMSADYPGRGIDYTGTSHTGIVETWADPNYPQLSRTDFVDAFPNLMRQAWRKHGCGHEHSRLCMFLRVRKSWARDHVTRFAQHQKKVENELASLKKLVRGPSYLFTGDPYAQCHDFLTKKMVFRTAEEMMANREYHRPAYNYCIKVFQQRGLEFFKKRIIDTDISKVQPGETQTQADARLVREMGKLVTEKAHNIRNQLGDEAGFGLEFDDRFDNYSKAQLYCSEHADLVYRIAWGREVYPESSFQGMMRRIESVVPESMIQTVSGGFIKVPWGEKDTVYAPKGVIEVAEGRQIWEVVGEMRRAFFGVNDE